VTFNVQVPLLHVQFSDVPDHGRIFSHEYSSGSLNMMRLGGGIGGGEGSV
jgi:hypothetical protein